MSNMYDVQHPVIGGNLAQIAGELSKTAPEDDRRDCRRRGGWLACLEGGVKMSVWMGTAGKTKKQRR